MTISEQKKICSGCKELKILTEFYKDKQTKDGLKFLCKICYGKYTNPRGREYNRRLKTDIIFAYGGKCVCCGESKYEFLTIDHINGNGRKHRRTIANAENSGIKFYKWIKDNNYPKDILQLLCWNCNCSKGHYGYCPHKQN